MKSVTPINSLLSILRTCAWGSGEKWLKGVLALQQISAGLIWSPFLPVIIQLGYFPPIPLMQPKKVPRLLFKVVINRDTFLVSMLDIFYQKCANLVSGGIFQQFNVLVFKRSGFRKLFRDWCKLCIHTIVYTRLFRSVKLAPARICNF